ncbi:MAG: type II-A CRISPR-associated protein Csn2 [Butyricicoccus sp.]
MNLAHPQLDHVLSIGGDRVATLVIEHPAFFREFLRDIDGQIAGGEGKTALSRDNKILPFDRHAEMIDGFLHFTLSRKPLLTKLTNRLEALAMEEENYVRTAKLSGEVEKYIMELAEPLPCSIYCSKTEFSGVLRAVGVDIVDDHESDLERLLDYMELTRELERERLFILVNLRSYYSDAEVEAFFASVLAHEFLILPVDSVFRARLRNEWRVTVDDDLCEF